MQTNWGALRSSHWTIISPRRYCMRQSAHVHFSFAPVGFLLAIRSPSLSVSQCKTSLPARQGSSTRFPCVLQKIRVTSRYVDQIARLGFRSRPSLLQGQARQAGVSPASFGGLEPNGNAMAFLFARTIVWCLFTYGVTLIITGSSLFKPLRSFVFERWRGSLLCRLVSCPMCVGFHVAWIASVGGLSLVGLGAFGSWAEGGGWHRALRAWADGCAGAAWCFAVHVVLAKLGAEDL